MPQSQLSTFSGITLIATAFAVATYAQRLPRDARLWPNRHKIARWFLHDLKLGWRPTLTLLALAIAATHLATRTHSLHLIDHLQTQLAGLSAAHAQAQLQSQAQSRTHTATVAAQPATNRIIGIWPTPRGDLLLHAPDGQEFEVRRVQISPNRRTYAYRDLARGHWCRVIDNTPVEPIVLPIEEKLTNTLTANEPTQPIPGFKTD